MDSGEFVEEIDIFNDLCIPMEWRVSLTLCLPMCLPRFDPPLNLCTADQSFWGCFWPSKFWETHRCTPILVKILPLHIRNRVFENSNDRIWLEGRHDGGGRLFESELWRLNFTSFPVDRSRPLQHFSSFNVQAASTCSSGTFITAHSALSSCIHAPCHMGGSACSLTVRRSSLHVPMMQAYVAHACLSPKRLDGSVNVCGQEPDIDHAECWYQDR